MNYNDDYMVIADYEHCTVEQSVDELEWKLHQREWERKHIKQAREEHLSSALLGGISIVVPVLLIILSILMV